MTCHACLEIKKKPLNVQEETGLGQGLSGSNVERWRIYLQRWFHPADEDHGSCHGWRQASSKGLWNTCALWRGGPELCPLLPYPSSLVFHTLFPNLFYLLAVHCRHPSAYRALTFQTRFLLAALALSISYPQLQRYTQHALKASRTQNNPPLKGKRKSFEEVAEKKRGEK